MTSKVTHTSYVINFLDIGFSSNKIRIILEDDIDTILKTIQFDSLADWQIIFNIVHSSDPRSLIRLYKQYPSNKRTKQKEIVIHIPMPIESIVSWGVEERQLVKLPVQLNENKYCSYINIDYKKFRNRKEYIIDAARKAISLCFIEGFTVNDIRVKAVIL